MISRFNFRRPSVGRFFSTLIFVSLFAAVSANPLCVFPAEEVVESEEQNKQTDKAKQFETPKQDEQAKQVEQAGLYVCQKTDAGAKLVKDGKTIWELVLDGPEQKPFIHPLTLPNGKIITIIRPSDHIWHLGLWFCWKYINGVNYWEPKERGGFLPAGQTFTDSSQIQVDGNGATACLKISYRPGDDPEGVVLTEDRKLTFSAPDPDGSYTIRSRHEFTAVAQEVTLDRTPPHAYGGGYAGLGLRLDPSISQFTASCSNGGADMTSIREKPADWVDYRDPESGWGVRFSVIKGTPETRFYAQKSPNYCFVNPAPVHTGPVKLKKGQKLELEYEIRIGALPITSVQ